MVLKKAKSKSVMAGARRLIPVVLVGSFNSNDDVSLQEDTLKLPSPHPRVLLILSRVRVGPQNPTTYT